MYTGSSSTLPATINWTDLPSDIVDIIVHLFDIIDFINFGATCRSWRSVTLAHIGLRCCRHRQNSSQIPWILFARPRIVKEMAPSVKRMKDRLASTVPPLHFYDFSREKSYFINHPPHLMPDINSREVRLIGSNNGYLIYNTNAHETWQDDEYLIRYQHYSDSEKSSNQNSVLYFYNPVNGTHFSLPLAPVFLRNKVIINTSPHYDNITVAVVCYDHNVDDEDGKKNCIAVIRTCDTEWTCIDLSEVIGDDFVEDIIFHQEHLYAITHHLKTVVFDNVNDATFSYEEVICTESPANYLLYVLHQVMLGNWVTESMLLESPDGKVLLLSHSHLVASSYGRDILSVHDVDEFPKRLNIPDNFERAPWLLFTPNLS